MMRLIDYFFKRLEAYQEFRYKLKKEYELQRQEVNGDKADEPIEFFIK